jgi:hypothetical protein
LCYYFFFYFSFCLLHLPPSSLSPSILSFPFFLLFLLHFLLFLFFFLLYLFYLILNNKGGFKGRKIPFTKCKFWNFLIIIILIEIIIIVIVIVIIIINIILTFKVEMA